MLSLPTPGGGHRKAGIGEDVPESQVELSMMVGGTHVKRHCTIVPVCTNLLKAMLLAVSILSCHHLTCTHFHSCVSNAVGCWVCRRPCEPSVAAAPCDCRAGAQPATVGGAAEAEGKAADAADNDALGGGQGAGLRRFLREQASKASVPLGGSALSLAHSADERSPLCPLAPV